MSTITTYTTYIGHDELVSYLNERKNKSFYGFLLRYREIICYAVMSITFLLWRELDNYWAFNFLKEAKKLEFNIDKEVKMERLRREKDFEIYWKVVIQESEIRREISDYQDEKEQHLHIVSNLDEEIQAKNNKLLQITSQLREGNLSDSESGIYSDFGGEDFGESSGGGYNYEDEDTTRHSRSPSPPDEDENVRNSRSPSPPDEDENVRNSRSPSLRNSRSPSPPAKRPAVRRKKSAVRRKRSKTTVPTRKTNLRNLDRVNYNVGSLTRRRKNKAILQRVTSPPPPPPPPPPTTQTSSTSPSSPSSPPLLTPSSPPSPLSSQLLTPSLPPSPLSSPNWEICLECPLHCIGQ